MFINNPRKPSATKKVTAGGMKPEVLSPEVNLAATPFVTPGLPLGRAFGPLGGGLVGGSDPSLVLDPGLGLSSPLIPGLGPFPDVGISDLGLVAARGLGSPMIPDVPADPNEKALDEAEFFLLSRLFSYVRPNETIPTLNALQDLRPAILSRLQQQIQQGHIPAPEIVEFLNQLQQLYALRPYLAATRQPPDPLGFGIPAVQPAESFMLPETKILENVHPPKGRGRGRGKSGRGRRAESPSRNDTGGTVSAPLLSAAGQGRISLAPVYGGPSVDMFGGPGASPPSTITSILSDSNLRNLLKGVLQAPEGEMDITDTASLSKLYFFQFPILNVVRHNPQIVSSLYDNYLDQCTQCGWRFKDQEKLSKHLDWHFRQNKREKEKV
jgi:hypothetical protein